VATNASADQQELTRSGIGLPIGLEQALTCGDEQFCRSWLAAASTPCALTALIRVVLANARHTDEVAERSYAHNNGFDKIVLAERDGGALRLHVWWPGQSPVDVEHVHDHAWDFASTIVTGSYRMDLYGRGSEGQEWFEYRYAFPEDRPDLHGLRLVGRTRLTRQLSIHLPRASSYAINRGQLHRVTAVSGSLTSSLVLQGPVVEDGSTVLSEDAIPAAANAPTVPFSGRELRARLERFVRALESGA
jgi:hypothetical protein